MKNFDWLSFFSSDISGENVVLIRHFFSLIPGVCGGANDAITVRSPIGTDDRLFPPTVCGTLTGQHSKLVPSSNISKIPIHTPGKGIKSLANTKNVSFTLQDKRDISPKLF